MKFRMMDGQEFTGRSYTDVVTNMSKDKLTPVRSIARYRRATAKRVADMYCVKIDATDDRAFVRSLVEAGLMEEVRAS